MNRCIILSIFSLLLIYANILLAQSSPELKNILWRNDIKKMIENFGEEHLVLREKGNIARQMEARSYTEKNGLRIQVFAGSDLNIANNFLSKIQTFNLDSVYIVQEKNLFKVQMGNYGNRRDAEIMLDRLRYTGFNNAWIVNATIHEPKPFKSAGDQNISDESTIETAGLVYAIQLFVTSDLEKSEKLKNDLAKTIQQEIWIKEQGTLWKILVGKFNDLEIAQQILGNIQSIGFPDAWITQVVE